MRAPRQRQVTARRSFTRVAHFHRALSPELQEVLWSSPMSLIERGETMRRTGQRWTVRLEWDSQPYVLKRYAPNWAQAALQLAIPAVAWSTWSFTRKLIRAGVRTPPPLACVENRWGPLRRDSFLMYPYVEGRILNSYFGAPEEKHNPIIARLWRQLDELWGRLGQLNAHLDDANLNNFVVAPTGDLWVIDLDKGRFHHKASAAEHRLKIGWKKLNRGVVIR
jgi:hypothetical protein